MPVEAGVSDTRASVTEAVVARTPLSVSLDRTLATIVPPVWEDPLTESFTALMVFGLTVTVAVAESQLVGLAASQMPYASEEAPRAVPAATLADALGAFSV